MRDKFGDAGAPFPDWGLDVKKPDGTTCTIPQQTQPAHCVAGVCPVIRDQRKRGVAALARGRGRWK
jgi:hypothetical protein